MKLIKRGSRSTQIDHPTAEEMMEKLAKMGDVAIHHTTCRLVGRYWWGDVTIKGKGAELEITAGRREERCKSFMACLTLMYDRANAFARQGQLPNG